MGIYILLFRKCHWHLNKNQNHCKVFSHCCLKIHMSAFNFGRIMIVTKSRSALVFVRSPTAISNSSRYLCSGKDTVPKEKTSSEQSISQNDDNKTEIKKDNET